MTFEIEMIVAKMEEANMETPYNHVTLRQSNPMKSAMQASAIAVSLPRDANLKLGDPMTLTLQKREE